jgi:hypothetical protein
MAESAYAGSDCGAETIEVSGDSVREAIHQRRFRNTAANSRDFARRESITAIFISDYQRIAANARTACR